MFINKYLNWQKSVQKLYSIYNYDESDDNIKDLSKIAFFNAVDNEINPVDIESSNYAYHDKDVQLYSDIRIIKGLQQKYKFSHYHYDYCQLFNATCICPKQEYHSEILLSNKILSTDILNVQQESQIDKINLKSMIDEIFNDIQFIDKTLIGINYEKITKKSLQDLLVQRMQSMTQIQIKDHPINLIKAICDLCSHPDIEQGKFTRLQPDQYHLLHLIVGGKKYFEKQDRKLYLLDSPTGTGKTESFILAQAMTKYISQPHPENSDPLTYIKRRNGINSIIFSNNELVCDQSIRRFSKYLDFKSQPSHRIEIILNKNNKHILIMSHYQVTQGPDEQLVFEQIYDLILSFSELEPIDLEFIGIQNPIIYAKIIPEYKYTYICNTRYQYMTQFKGQLIKNFVVRREDGSTIKSFINDSQFTRFDISQFIQNTCDIILIPLYNYQFLNIFGILNHTQQVQTVVYDELDVFYKQETNEEFNKFFFSQLYNLTAQTIIFASATLDESLINRNDYNLSQESSQLIRDQIVSNMANSQIINDFPIFISMGSKINVSSVQDFQDIFSKFWQVGNVYFYFDLERADCIFASYLHIKGNIMIIRTPNSYKKFKIISDQEGLAHVLIDKLKKFKFIYVSNRILRADQHRPIYPHHRQIISNISLMKDLPLLRFIMSGVQIFEGKTTQQDVQDIMIVIEKLTKLNELKFEIDENVESYKKTLIVTINDKFMTQQLQKIPQYKQFSNPEHPQQIGIYEEFKQIGYNKLKQKTPFNIHRLKNLKTKLVNIDSTDDPSQFVFYDDFTNIGRGIDIEGLGQIILIIPLFYSFEDFGFNKSEFKQILGRVARFGKIGIVQICFLKISIDDITQIQQDKYPEDKHSDLISLTTYLQDGQRRQIKDINVNELMEHQKTNYNQVKQWIQERGNTYSMLDISNQLSRLDQL